MSLRISFSEWRNLRIFFRSVSFLVETWFPAKSFPPYFRLNSPINSYNYKTFHTLKLFIKLKFPKIWIKITQITVLKLEKWKCTNRAFLLPLTVIGEPKLPFQSTCLKTYTGNIIILENWLLNNCSFSYSWTSWMDISLFLACLQFLRAYMHQIKLCFTKNQFIKVIGTGAKGSSVQHWPLYKLKFSSHFQNFS